MISFAGRFGLRVNLSSITDEGDFAAWADSAPLLADAKKPGSGLPDPGHRIQPTLDQRSDASPCDLGVLTRFDTADADSTDANTFNHDRQTTFKQAIHARRTQE